MEKANPEQAQLPYANPPEKLIVASTISANVAGQTLALHEVAALKAVSYTHLDVYKRQIFIRLTT